MVEKFFVQKIKVNLDYINIDRYQLFTKLCQDKKVLHVGFVDYPRTNIKRNMHIMLDKVSSELVGVDPNKDYFSNFEHLLSNKRMYNDFTNIKDEFFDMVIVPEVIEHVDNMAKFIQEVSNLNFNKIYFTAPDAFLLHSHVSYNSELSQVTELVHPDHNCWFSPYTLKNVVLKYSNLELEEMFYVGRSSIMGIFSKKI